MYSWVWQAQYAPYRPVAVALGGVGECSDSLASLSSSLSTKAYKSVNVYSYFALKTLWREGTIEAPSFCSDDTPQSECTMQCPSTASVVSKMLDVKLSALESADNTLSFANLRRERRRHQRRRRASAQHSPWDPADDERSATGFGSARTSTDDSVDAAVATADASTDDALTSSETASTPSSARGKASRSTSTADSSDMASLLSSDDDDDGASTTLGQMLSVIGTVCDSTLVPGDAVDASAPYDVAWWSIFPTVERLWVRRKLSRGFSDEVRALCTQTHTHTHTSPRPVS